MNYPLHLPSPFLLGAYSSPFPHVFLTRRLFKPHKKAKHENTKTRSSPSFIKILTCYKCRLDLLGITWKLDISCSRRSSRRRRRSPVNWNHFSYSHSHIPSTMVANSINSMDTSDDTNTINNNPLLFAENPMFTIIRSQINSGLDNQKQVWTGDPFSVINFSSSFF